MRAHSGEGQRSSQVTTVSLLSGPAGGLSALRELKSEVEGVGLGVWGPGGCGQPSWKGQVLPTCGWPSPEWGEVC